MVSVSGECFSHLEKKVICDELGLVGHVDAGGVEGHVVAQKRLGVG